MKAACIQLKSGCDILRNIEQTADLIRAAHSEGARFIATPENTLLMEEGSTALFAKIKPEHETDAAQYFSDLAKTLNIDLLIGSMAIKLSQTKAANRSYLFGQDGTIRARYDKMHMFDVDINANEVWRESANYKAGQTPVMAPIDDFTVGLSICYDVRFAALYKYYAQSGANVLCVPSAFTAVTGKAHWEILLRARAIETSSYVIAPAQGGVHENGRATWGRSMIIDPWGRVLAKLDHDEPGYCIADLSLDTLNKVRRQIPAWNQDTPLGQSL